jgi:phospholipase C
VKALAALVLLLALGVTGAAVRAAPGPTTTPIQHLVVIYQENSSFDHYFGTYPVAKNPIGSPRFVAAKGTPAVDGLTPALLTANPNLYQPFRLDRADIFTCDMDHDYSMEQKAFDGGKMDRFVEFTSPLDPSCDRSGVMGYFDGNTVTALWNYAQRFSMSDAFFGSTFGPSTPGALNLVAGQTHGASPAAIPAMVANGTVIGDPDPTLDSCGNGVDTVTLVGRNVGDLLNARNLSWGWFQGGFRDCDASHTALDGTSSADYSPHHDPFQYWAQSANPNHLPPTSPTLIGKSDQAHHQYDLADFWTAAQAGRLPAVSFLKAPSYQDGHPGNSNPLDEQTFLVQTINRLQKLPEWKSTAIFVAWDDSDGWYDHAFAATTGTSSDPVYDGLYGVGLCGNQAPGAYSDRCGPGPRVPFVVISPYAKRNYVSHVQLERPSSGSSRTTGRSAVSATSPSMRVRRRWPTSSTSRSRARRR